MTAGAPPGPVLVTADAVGGVFPYSLELSRGIVARGGRVVLAVLGPAPSAAQRAAVAAIESVELVTVPGKLEWMDDPWDDVARAGEALLALEARTRPSVVHLGGYAHAALPFRSPKLVVGHSCVVSWWRASWGAEPPPVWERYRREVRRGLDAADLVVTPTRAMQGDLERCHGPLRHTRVIRNGRSARLFPPGRKEPFVLAAGRLWDRAKNLESLARAAPRLPWPVRVAGDLGDAAAPAGVEALGRLDEAALAAAYGRAAIYALPARYEPFGLSVLEAALARCALVLGDIPSLREIWNGAALFVPPDDENAIADAIARFRSLRL